MKRYGQKPLWQLRVSKMNFELDHELERIQKLARELAADFAKRAAQHGQERAPLPDENYARLKEAGFYGLVAPKQYGGLGADVLGWVVAADELAQGCPSTAVSFHIRVATRATYLMKANLPKSTNNASRTRSRDRTNCLPRFCPSQAPRAFCLQPLRAAYKTPSVRKRRAESAYQLHSGPALTQPQTRFHQRPIRVLRMTAR